MAWKLIANLFYSFVMQLFPVQQVAQRREDVGRGAAARGAVRAPEAVPPRAHVQRQGRRARLLPHQRPQHGALHT